MVENDGVEADLAPISALFIVSVFLFMHVEHLFKEVDVLVHEEVLEEDLVFLRPVGYTVESQDA